MLTSRELNWNFVTLQKKSIWNLTWQNRLDAVEDDRDGKQGAEVRHRVWDHLTPREQVADIVAQAEDHNAKDDGD